MTIDYLVAKSTVVACIVTYNPDIHRLRCNIKAISPQVSQVIIVDNNSINVSLIKVAIQDIPNTHIIINTKNNGIAKALNQAALYAQTTHFEWIITLDQDSIVPSSLVARYISTIDNKEVALICCIINDRNIGILPWQSINDEVEEVDECITSASMLRIEAWHKVNGFNEDLFIDGVDIDMCYRLRKNHYKIIRVNTVHLLHELGKAEIKTFMGKPLHLFHYPPLRCYYITRNTLYIGIKYKRFCYYAKLTIKRCVIMIFFETHRLLNLIAILYAIRDIIIYKRLGKAPNTIISLNNKVTRHSKTSKY